MSNYYSLHIGLNYVDPNHYSGWDGKLISCENDAYDMQLLVKSLNYQSKTLIRKDATREKVINEIIALSKVAIKNDTIYISYSGHGGQVPDLNSDEDDLLDETWCLFDGQLIDDELKKLCSLFKKGVKIFVTSDSCHSGSILKVYDSFNTFNEDYKSKNMPSEIVQRVYYKNKSFYDNLLSKIDSEKNISIQASVKLLSGCQDDEFSYDGPFNGVFTASLKKIWNGGKFSGNYSDFYQKITKSIEKTQTPNLLNIGIRNTHFDKQKPFI